jgi:hypothetical protein
MSRIARSFALVVVLVLSLSGSLQAASSDRGGPQGPSLLTRIIRFVRLIAMPHDETMTVPKP